jgi:hypothetical protein
MDDPTPAEILKRRAEIHRNRHEHDDAESILAAPQHEHVIPGDEQSEPEFRTIYELGLPARIAAGLERYGVMFAGELCGYTAERLRLIKDFGEGSVQAIGQALADIGLSLRRKAADEPTPPLPAPIAAGRTARRLNHLSAQQLDRIFQLIAGGASQREIARRMHICRWTVWNHLRLFKDKVRSLFQLGATPCQVETRLGRDRWHVWLKSLDWEERKRR